jgi:hypothetical protein
MGACRLPSERRDVLSRPPRGGRVDALTTTRRAEKAARRLSCSRVGSSGAGAPTRLVAPRARERHVERRVVPCMRCRCTDAGRCSWRCLCRTSSAAAAPASRTHHPSSPSPLSSLIRVSLLALGRAILPSRPSLAWRLSALRRRSLARFRILRCAGSTLQLHLDSLSPEDSGSLIPAGSPCPSVSCRGRVATCECQGCEHVRLPCGTPRQQRRLRSQSRAQPSSGAAVAGIRMASSIWDGRKDSAALRAGQERARGYHRCGSELGRGATSCSLESRRLKARPTSITTTALWWAAQEHVARCSSSRPSAGRARDPWLAAQGAA